MTERVGLHCSICDNLCAGADEKLKKQKCEALGLPSYKWEIGDTITILNGTYVVTKQLAQLRDDNRHIAYYQLENEKLGPVLMSQTAVETLTTPKPPYTARI